VGHASPGRSKRKYAYVGAAIAIGIALIVVIAVVATQASRKSLYGRVNVDDIMVHLQEFQSIAANHSGSRSTMTGYDASGAYVIEQLEKHKVPCDITKQEFVSVETAQLKNPTLSMDAPMSLEFQYLTDFAGMKYGGNGDFNLTSIETQYVPGGGCNETNYDGFVDGRIAVLEVFAPTAACDLITASYTAQQQGASAVLFMNGKGRSGLIGSRVRGAVWEEGAPLMDVPVLTLQRSIGLLLSQPGTKVTLTASVRIYQPTSFNIICDSHEGDPDSIVAFGAHLDSVPAGPGINDDGSGSATLLEIALRWSRMGMKPKNRIRFAFWGSEEEGLIGSRYYVRELLQKAPQELAKIKAYYNYDMLASKNYIIGIKQGRDALPSAQQASIKLQGLFQAYMEQKIKQNYELVQMQAGSDFVPFVEAGIPTTGLATGAGGIKTDDERALFGGMINVPLDPCYHLACDTVDDISQEALKITSKAAAYAMYEVAMKSDLEKWYQEE